MRSSEIVPGKKVGSSRAALSQILGVGVGGGEGLWFHGEIRKIHTIFS